MELLDSPMPFVEAVKHLLAKKVMPTGLGSAELRDLDASIRRQSLFSARNEIEGSLDTIKNVVESIINPKTEKRADRVTDENPEGNVTTGFNPATARAAIRDSLAEHGYMPAADERGTIKDLSSSARIDLVVKTNVQLAQGAGHFVQANSSDDVVEAFPAWELVRFEDKEVPRGEKLEKGMLVPDPGNDWPSRFAAAAEASGDEDAARVLEETGRMMARKDSPLWQSLGDGAGGYQDTLSNPYPPFAFNSGMWVQDVSRAEAVEAGLIDEDDDVKPADFDFASLFSALFANDGPPDEARDEGGRWTSADAGEFYHGTSAKNVDSILKSGIKPTDKSLGFKAAFVGKNKDLAFAYGAGSASMNDDKEVAVVVIKHPQGGTLLSPKNARNVAFSRSGIKPSMIDRVEIYRANAGKNEAPLRVVSGFANDGPPDEARDNLGRWTDSNGGGLSQKDNIQRGKNAIERALRQKSDVPKAMHRKEIGQIDFIWGRPGTSQPDAEGRTHSDGYGISHIAAKHGESQARLLPEIIAKGKVIPHETDPNKRYLQHDDHLAVLDRKNKKTAYVITSLDDPKRIKQLKQKSRPNWLAGKIEGR